MEVAPDSLQCKDHKLRHLQLSDAFLDGEIPDWIESCESIVAVHDYVYERVHEANEDKDGPAGLAVAVISNNKHRCMVEDVEERYLTFLVS